MDLVSALREQFKQAHGLLDGTMQDVTPEQAHWPPPGRANPLGATYAHVLLGEDLMVNGLLRGATPLCMSGWAGKAGMSEPPPMPNEGPWNEWARKVTIDLDVMRKYGRAVFQATDEYLASLDDAALERDVDLSVFQLGRQRAGWFIDNILLSHVSHHTGEIACLKGIQGAKGYPF